MNNFSPAQSARITDAAKVIAQKRDVIDRLEGELEIAKQNLKLAKTEKEPLPNLFAREARG